MSDTHEHLEHAEHAEHAAHDPFSSRVALTIAVIAAILAAVTLLSHRAHNETLQAQIEAGSLRTAWADKWAEFQANNIRKHEYESFDKLLGVVAKEPGKAEEAKEVQGEWKKKIANYTGTKLDSIKAEADKLKEQTEARMADSHTAHDMGSRFDLGELAVELGLVLCSIAILTKKAGFWYAGMAAAAVGAIVAATAFLVTPHAPGHGHENTPAEQHATEKAPGH